MKTKVKNYLTSNLKAVLVCVSLLTVETGSMYFPRITNVWLPAYEN